MHIAPIRPHDAIDLADFVPIGPVTLWWSDGVLADSVSHRHPGGLRRWLYRYRVVGRTLDKLDATGFVVDADHVAEDVRFRGTDGINLHQRPIRLPRRLRRGRWHRPLGSEGSGRVAVGWAGLAEVTLAADRERLHLVCLVAEDGSTRRAQWLAAGLGEIALGSAAGIRRHVLGGRSSGAVWWSGLPEAIGDRPRPDFTGPFRGGPSTGLF